MELIFIGILLIPFILLMIATFLDVLSQLLSGGDVDERRDREDGKLIVKERADRFVTWKDGAYAIGIDAEKYAEYADILIERYPLAMDNLVKLEWLSVNMNEEEKHIVRSEYEKKFDELVMEEERRSRERMSEEIAFILEGFKESRYVGEAKEHKK